MYFANHKITNFYSFVDPISINSALVTLPRVPTFTKLFA